MSAALALVAGWLLAACSDSYVDSLPAPQPGTITICLGAPAQESRADAADSPDDLSPATADERTITDLRYFAFPSDPDAPGAVTLKGALLPPSADEMANERYKEYVVRDVEPGSYRVYVVANMPQCATVGSEEELKALRLSYSPTELPRPGRLPMIYEPQGETVVDPGGTVVTANLQFTCVKVRYNLIFDKENNQATQDAFGNCGLIIKAVNGRKLSAETPLVLGAPMSGITSSGDTFNAPLTPGRYFATWTRNDHAGGDEDVITDTEGVPATYASKWVYQGTLYLPERYIGNEEEQSQLTVEAVVVSGTHSPKADGTVDMNSIPTGPVNTYTIPLGHANGQNQPRQFPRGTYYEIIGRIETTEFTELQADVKVSDWVPVPMAHAGHTTLTVDKTVAKVTSIETDSIHYTSNAPEVVMGCDAIIDGKPVIVKYEQDTRRRVIKFRINPAIPIGKFGEGSDFPPTGRTKIWIQANHVRKYLDVTYNVEPLFEVEPEEVTINWLEDQNDHPTYTKTFRFQTNLGGIKGVDFPVVLTNGSAQIRLECANPAEAVGTFTATALCNPGTTTTFNVTLSPLDGSHPELAKTVTIHVKPPVGDYRIYFRAINDNQGANNSTEAEFNAVSPEGGSANWNDSWGAHKLYCYTQMGETDKGNIPEYYVWLFSPSWPGDTMTPDNNNTGWYYHTYVPDKTATNTLDSSTKTIRPGETLMIFNSGADGQHRHRCSHHLDPGIQLFDYEDREGWVLYDPLCAPYYRVYDERPEIVNATYDVYTQKRLTRWEINYGVASYENGTISTYKIKCSNTVGTQVTVDGVTMYHYPSVFKAPAGDLAKNIVYYFEDGTSTTIFGGENFATSDDTARGYCYLIDNKWTWSRTPMHVEQPAMRRVYLYNANPYLSNPRLYYWNEGDTPVAWPGIAMQQYNGSSTWYCVDIPLKYMNFILCDGETKLTGDCTFNNSDPTITITSKGQIIDDRP
jgi:hypothetical protein